MKRTRSRLISLVATVALIVSMMPVGSASGVVVTDGGSSTNGVPEQNATVRTTATPKGIRVTTSSLGKDVVSFDVYRSELQGLEGDKVNGQPVTGNVYVDETAQPGLQYYYTLKIVERRSVDNKALLARSDNDETLPQVKADVIKVHAREVAAKSAHSKGKVTRPEEPASMAAASGVEALAMMQALATTQTGTPNTRTNVSGTWSGVVFVRGDVVVPAGKTLTIAPGTKVYFDTVMSQTTTPYQNSYTGEPTPDIDLIVHGKLVAQGTSASPILFTSVNSLVASAAAGAMLPKPGDWGSIFNDSKAASVMSYCRVEYGQGLWSYNTNRPYIDRCTITEVSNIQCDAAVYFQNPVGDATTPQIRITNNSIATDEEGIWVDWEARSGITVGDITINPYIAYNDVRSGKWGIDLEIYDNSGAPVAPGNHFIKGTITGNTVYTESSEALYLWGDSYGDRDITISTVLSNNTWVSESDDAAYVESDAYGAGGAAYVIPTFTGDKFSSTAYGMDMYAYSGDSSTTAMGHAVARPKFTTCSFKSTDDYAWYIEVDSRSKGSAIAEPVFSGGSFESGSGTGGYAESDSSYGYASVSPQFTNVTGRAANGSQALYLDAYTNGEGMTARCNPRWVGGRLIAGNDDALEAYAESSYGPAECKPYISGAEFRAYNYPVYLGAYGGNSSATGTADVSGTLLNSTLVGIYDDCYYGEAYGGGVAGNASASPYISGCSLTSEDYYGLELYAYAYEGNATASPRVINSDIWGYDSAIYAYAERYNSNLGNYTASVSPSVSGSTLFAKYDSVLYLEADNGSPGNANVKPVLTDSNIINGYYDYGLEAEVTAEDTGTADLSPVMTRVSIKSDYAPLYLNGYANSPGSHAKVNGTYTDCSFTSSWDDCVAMWSYGYSGTAENKPVFTRCIFDGMYDYGYDGGAFGYSSKGSTFTCAPTFNGGDMSRTGDGIYCEAANYYWYTGDDNSDYLVAPKITNMPIYSTWDDGVYTSAYTYGSGDAINKSSVVSSPIKAYYGNYFYAQTLLNPNYPGTGGVGDALTQCTVSGTSTTKMGVESYDDYGVYVNPYSENGNTSDKSVLKYLSTAGEYAPFYVQSYATTGTSNLSSAITNNVTTSSWVNSSYGMYLYSYAGGGVTGVSNFAPVISGNALGGSYSQGIYAESAASNVSKMSANITGNSIANCFSDGIYLSSSASESTGTLQITRNRIVRPEGNGIELSGIPNGLVQGNTITNPGWMYQNNHAYDTAGILWYDASYPFASVRGNTIVGARSSAIRWFGGIGKVEYNSFVDAAGNANRPYNYWTNLDATSTATPYSARYNWWGTTSSSDISATVLADQYSGKNADLVDFSSPLPTRQPKVKSISKSKSGSTYTFKVTFDRPMDTSIKYLKFGKSSPYATYKTKTGTWNTAGTVLTVKFSGTLAAGKYYFSAAKDLPGNTLLSTSKYFMP